MKQTHSSQSHYAGKLSVYQLEGEKKKKYQRYEKDFLNTYQNFLYHRAIFGISIYNQEEIKAMGKPKRKRIIKTHKRAQHILNMWKQEILINKTNNIFKNIFPNSPITKELRDQIVPQDKFKCYLSFKALGITKEMVVEKLMKEGILAKNFYELKKEEYASRIYC